MEAIVEHNYQAQEPDELTLRKGDVIKEIRVMVGGWWEGTLRDKRGMFPDNFVKVLDPLPSATGGDAASSTKSEEVTLRNGSSGRRFCKVLYSYEPCNEDELALIPQDSIEFLEVVEEGWWRGRLRGQIGVFPSNFVSPPVFEDSEKRESSTMGTTGCAAISTVARSRRELCRVLFPYDAANEDELTLVEGEIIALISRDAPDKGWWKGELHGQIGLFPDNFVEVLGPKNEEQENQVPSKMTKHIHSLKKSEKAHVRKSLDICSSLHTESIKKSPSSTVPIASPTNSTISCSGTGEKRHSENHSLMSSLKRFVGAGGNGHGNGTGNASANGNGSGNSADLGEELDGIERGEGTPLSHLTASRAKAPRRRPPSTQHLRHNTGVVPAGVIPSGANVSSMIMEESIVNGNVESSYLEHLREDDADGTTAKARRKAPWVEELKLNQMERRKVAAAECNDKIETKKEKSYTRSSTNETNIKQELEIDDGKQKDKQLDSASQHPESITISASSPPAYVPYHLYSQLLERVSTLEEKQTTLQETIKRLTEQLEHLLSKFPKV